MKKPIHNITLSSSIFSEITKQPRAIKFINISLEVARPLIQNRVAAHQAHISLLDREICLIVYFLIVGKWQESIAVFHSLHV